jgi:hypothetical protein
MTEGLCVMPPREQAPVAGEPFHHWTATDGSIWMNFYRAGDGFLLRFPGLADFRVAPDGSEASCWIVPGIDDGTLEHLFLNQVLPLMQSARGDLIFHASAVECLGGAIAFLGVSGRGKSTLAASFAISGKRFLTDDGFGLELTADGYDVLPSHPSIRVWDDTQAALRTDQLVKAAPVAYTEKARVLSGVGLPHCAEPRPLIAAFFLGEGATDEISFQRKRGADALAGWMSNMFVVDIKDRKRISRNLEAVAEIAESVPSIALDYPRRYEALGDLRAAILTATLELRGSR